MTAAPTPLAASPALAVVGADRTVPLLDGTERRFEERAMSRVSEMGGVPVFEL